METFPEGYVRGLFQGMLSEDTAAPPHDLIQNFNRELNNLNDETALTALVKCGTRVYVFYGCSLIFLKNGQESLPSFDFVIVKKLRCEYYNQGVKCLAALSNAFFHTFCDNLFYQPFECIQRRYLAFNIAHMRIHNSIIGSLTPKHPC